MKTNFIFMISLFFALSLSAFATEYSFEKLESGEITALMQEGNVQGVRGFFPVLGTTEFRHGKVTRKPICKTEDGGIYGKVIDDNGAQYCNHYKNIDGSPVVGRTADFTTLVASDLVAEGTHYKWQPFQGEESGDYQLFQEPNSQKLISRAIPPENNRSGWDALFKQMGNSLAQAFHTGYSIQGETEACFLEYDNKAQVANSGIQFLYIVK